MKNRINMVFMLFLLLAAGCSSDRTTPANPARGSFAVTAGQMDTQSVAPATALLKDGTVLVCGGTYDVISNKAYILNPDDKSVTPVGPMNDARVFHTATTLQNGTVLIAGGVGKTAILDSAELYNPADRTFRRITLPLNGGRSDHTATLLKDGRVLLAGGARTRDIDTGDQIFLDDAELYNPAAESFSVVANTLSSAKIGHVAVLLQDGSVLVTGGASANPDETGMVSDLFTPAANRFTRTGDTMENRLNPAAAIMTDGRVLVSGGYRSTGAKSEHRVLASSEIYDPASGSFSAGPNMNVARLRHRMVGMPSGDLLVVGGSKLAYGTSSTLRAEWYRTATDSFENGPQTAAVRDSVSAELLPDGRVLMVGTHAAAELYDPATGRFSSMGGLTQARGGHTMTVLPDGMVLIAGGVDGEGYPLATAELFDPRTGHTRRLAAAMQEARTLHTASLLANGKVLLAGGGHNSAELFDPRTRSFETVPSLLPKAVSGQSAIALKDGRILLAGGIDDDSEYWESLDLAVIYDPAANSFSQTGSMNSPRRHQCAALLADGRMLMAGGKNENDLDSTELYDPATGRWTAGGTMSSARSMASATLLPDGAVLIAGGAYGEGINVTILDSAELFDPATGLFRLLAATLPAASSDHAAILLQDGRVLLLGGSALAQVYDPLTGRFYATSPPMANRSGPPLSVLHDGRVLVSGAIDRITSAINLSIELFDPR